MRNARSFAAIAAGIVIAAVIISATIFASSTFHTTVTMTETTTTTQSNSTRCVTTNNSVGCVTMSGTTTIDSSCFITPLGKGLYIHTVTDNGQPLNNTLVAIYFASPICPGVTISITGQLLRTNASGWTSYTLNGAGRYSFTIQYSSKQYNFSVLEKANQTTYATVKLPSGNLSAAYVP